MSVYLYSQQITGDKHCFRLIKSVNVSGNKSGIFPKYFKKYINKEVAKPILWEVTGADFIFKLDELKTGNTLVIDWLPNKTNNSLLVIQTVWAYTAANWTVFLIKTREIEADLHNKWAFEINNQQASKDLYTFWYMRGGYEQVQERKYWSFHRTNPTNSAFLNKDMLQHFMKILSKELKQESDPIEHIRNGFEAIGYV